jgi:hypothetical protein
VLKHNFILQKTTKMEKKKTGAGFRGGAENINRNGRPKGAKNKSTQTVRQAYELLLKNNIGKLQKWLDKVAEERPDRAIELLLNDLSKYVLPSLSRAEIEFEGKVESIGNQYDFGKLSNDELIDLLKKFEKAKKEGDNSE